MGKKTQNLTRLERIRLMRESAMPGVKKLVGSYGRSVIQACLNDLRTYEKESRRLKDLKKEVADLEDKIK